LREFAVLESAVPDILLSVLQWPLFAWKAMAALESNLSARIRDNPL
jgi:hypothetical protein